MHQTAARDAAADTEAAGRREARAEADQVAKRRAFRVYYRVRDNLGETADTLLVKLHGRVIVRKATAFGEAKNKLYFFRVGSKLRKGTYRLELRSRDHAGNVSKTAVAKLHVR